MQDPQPTSAGLFDELKRRRVVRVAVTYAGAAFVLLQAAQLVLPTLDDGDRIYRWLVWTALAGLPLALILGWLFDWTAEGIRLTGRRGAGRVVARPGMLLGGAGTVVAAGLAFAAFVNLPRAASAEMPAGADLIAVLPFEARGEGVEVLEEGMVDLLSRNLDQIGAVRTVDPRTVLARWQRHAEDGITPEEALAVGREANAGSILTGAVTSVGGQVRITADLLALDGARIANVRVDGSASDILALVDSLSLALMREIWRSEQPAPQLDVAALTSGNLDAIRAYLEGERHYRASRWDSAMIAYRRAVEEDSLFPLAHRRLAATAGWMGEAAAGRRSAEIARRLADRLPEREQTMVRVEELRSNDRRPEAIDTLSAYVERYPDDPEGWFYLADDLYHLHGGENAPPNRGDESEVLWMFDRALELDPGFAPALIHPLELAFRAGDTAQVGRYVEMMQRASAAEPEAVALYRDALAALDPAREPADVAGLLARIVAADSGSMDLSRQAARAARYPVLRAVALRPRAERDAVVAGLRERRRAGAGAATLGVAAEILLAAGRTQEAQTLLAGAGALGPEMREAMALRPVYAGHLDAPPAGLTLSPFARAATALVRAVDAGDPAALRAAIAGVRGLADADPRTREALVGAGAGFAAVLAGDTAGGLRQVETALEGTGMGMSVEALWFRWLERSAAHPATRPRVMEALQRPWPGFAAYEVRRQRVLAAALAADGRAAEAQAALARYRVAVE